jgi:hypothetical protein
VDIIKEQRGPMRCLYFINKVMVLSLGILENRYVQPAENSQVRELAPKELLFLLD